MNCDTATELIEPLAAGEIEGSGELGAHLDSCPRCAADLVVAQLVNRWLVSSRALAPRQLTARVLQQLPSRTWDVRDGIEAWLDTMAALSLLVVSVGIWFLAEPAFLGPLIDTTRFAVSGLSGLLLESGIMSPTNVAIAVVGVMALISLGPAEEA